MKTKNLISKDWSQKWSVRHMTMSELKMLDIDDDDDYEYFVCENWLAFLTNYISYEQINRELSRSINIDFEVEIATKQKASIKKFKKPVVTQNNERGRRPDIRSSLRSGMARYQTISFQKTIKKISSRKINFACSWDTRDKAKEKIYSLLSTQNDTERVFINFVGALRNSAIKNRNAVIWFNDLDFDMFKAQRKNFYPIISHNLSLAFCNFVEEVEFGDTEKHPNAKTTISISGLENLQTLLSR